MKSFIKIISLIVLTFSMFSCGESESTVNKEDRIREVNPKREARENRPSQDNGWTMSYIIEMWVENLDMRLSLSSDVKSNIKTIYTNAYLQKGGDLDKTSTKEEAFELRKEIVKSTQEEVMPLLTEDQQAYYKKLIKD